LPIESSRDTVPARWTRRQTLQRAAAAGLALPAASWLAACGGSESRRPAEAFLRTGALGGTAPINPFNDEGDFAALDVLLPGLTALDRDAGVYRGGPYGLADEFELLEDGMVVRATLRAGQTWSDGRPITVEDVEWNLRIRERLADGVMASDAEIVEGLQSIEAEGDRTVVVRFKEPSFLRSRSFSFWMIPKHVWEPYTKGKAERAGGVVLEGSDFVSAGPFVLERFQKRQTRILRERREWKGRDVRLQTLGTRFFANTEALFAALRNGDVNVIENLSPSITLRDLDRDRFQVLEGDGTRYTYAGFNLDRRRKDHRELLRRDVRAALDMCCNRQAIVEVAFFGLGRPAGGVVPPGLAAYFADDIQPPPFDPERAAAMLDGLGYRAGSDGIRQGEDGPMRYQVLASADDPWTDREFNILQEGFRQAGVALDLKTYGEDVLYDILLKREYDLQLWYFELGDDPIGIFETYVSDALEGGYSDSGYADPELDRLFAQQLVAPDLDRRVALIGRMQAIMQRDRPVLPLVYLPNLAAADKRFTGYELAVRSSQGVTGGIPELAQIRPA
jgi:peptide/nickel transport system substrate-binding protein